MKKIYSMLILSMFSLALFAQGRLITGKVTDKTNSGLPGVTILVKGTTTGTVTDLDGNYRLNTSGETLIFSFVGFVTQEINIGNQSTINVVLSEDAKMLDELVVIGYGVVKKKDLTTAVAIVGSEELKDRPIVSAAQALQGKAAGVQVINSSGKPGSIPSIRVRGATSVQAGNEPLYVVDGIPTTDISGLNPGDIESMSILKDASSAAIYGAQGANGVVIITTRSGKEKKPSINFTSYYGITTLRKNVEVLNTKEYRDLMNEIGEKLDPSQTKFNNWTDETFGTGSQQSYQLSVSGGNEKTSYFVSGGYLNEVGLVEPAQYSRYNFRVNLDTDIRSWFRVGTNITAWSSTSKDTPDNASSGRGGVIMSALNTPPFLSVYKNDGSGQFDPNPFQPSWENPVAYMEGPDQKSRDNKLLGNVYGEITFLQNFKFKSRVGVDVTGHQYDYYLDPFRTNFGRNNHGIGRSDKANHDIWIAENTLDFSKKLNDHNIDILLGNSAQKYQGNGTYIEGTDYTEDTNITSIWAANVSSGRTWQSEWAAVSFFGRAAYNFKSKYYLTASVRRDGSSKLADNNKWGTLPAISAAWRISGEEFMKGISVITDLKLRGGWGKTGNINGLGDYASKALIGYTRTAPDTLLNGPGTYAISLGNPDLKWETTSQTNLGFDLGMFNSRVQFSFDAYYKKTNDLILDVKLTSSLPVSSFQTNAGELVNKGIEFNLNTVNIDKKRLKWSSAFNMSFNKNEVTRLDYTKIYHDGNIYSNNQEVSIVIVGQPLGSFFGYISDGVDPATGQIIYRDINNNGYVDTRDRTIIGYAEPDFILGFTNDVSYNRLSLNVFIQGCYGNEVFNATRVDLEGMFDSKNQSTAVLDRWQQPGDITDIPKATKDNFYNVRNSTRFIEDGSYVRLKSITLSYELLNNSPKFKTIKRASVYVTGQNLITLTKYTGFDPEVNAYGSSSVAMGIDYGIYPQSRTIVFGINVEL